MHTGGAVELRLFKETQKHPKGHDPWVPSLQVQCGCCSYHHTDPFKIIHFHTGNGGKPTHLQEVPPFMHFLDVFIRKNAASSLELTGALSGSPRDNRLMHTMSSQEKREQRKHNSRWINSLINEADTISNTGPGRETTYRISS